MCGLVGQRLRSPCRPPRALGPKLRQPAYENIPQAGPGRAGDEPGRGRVRRFPPFCCYGAAGSRPEGAPFPPTHQPRGDKEARGGVVLSVSRNKGRVGRTEGALFG